MHTLNRLFLTLLCVNLGACKTHTLDTELHTEGGLTVSRIYHDSIEKNTPFINRPMPRLAYYDNAASTHGRVKTLDNPSIPLYVYPHVALIGDEQILKPGYTTEFFLYKQNQYALSSESY